MTQVRYQLYIRKQATWTFWGGCPYWIFWEWVKLTGHDWQVMEVWIQSQAALQSAGSWVFIWVYKFFIWLFIIMFGQRRSSQRSMGRSRQGQKTAANLASPLASPTRRLGLRQLAKIAAWQALRSPDGPGPGLPSSRSTPDSESKSKAEDEGSAQNASSEEENATAEAASSGNEQPAKEETKEDRLRKIADKQAEVVEQTKVLQQKQAEMMELIEQLKSDP